MDGRAIMSRIHMLAFAIIAAAVLAPAPAAAQTETSVTIAGAGQFPGGATYLGLPLNSLTAGVGLGVAGSWAAGQFQVTLTGTTVLGNEQSIVVNGRATTGVASAPGTATFSGVATVDPGDGTPPVPGVPFAALVVPGVDGAGSLTIHLGATNLPAVPINEGYVTVQ
jgi:hypothetical protein